MRKWIAGVLLVALPCMAVAADQPGSSKKEQDARLDQVFRGLDTDKSGTISRAEAELKAPAIAENFDQFDTNHDGMLTKKEIKEAFAAADKRRREFSQRLDMADKDKNGKLSRDEARLLPNISANFDAIDSNHDEQLVIKEIADYVRAMSAAAPAPGSPVPGSTAPAQ